MKVGITWHYPIQKAYGENLFREKKEAEMKLRSKALKVCGISLLLGLLIWFVVANSTLLLNSKMDRLTEEGLPTITIEGDNTVYCRMKADDFRFPLPPGAVAVNPRIVSGSFDTVKGSLIVTFPEGRPMSPRRYEEWLKARLQTGGWVTASKNRETEGMLVTFSYFGDK